MFRMCWVGLVVLVCLVWLILVCLVWFVLVCFRMGWVGSLQVFNSLNYLKVFSWLVWVGFRTGLVWFRMGWVA